VADKEQVGLLITDAWAPIFKKVEPEYDIDDFLDRVESVLPDYSDFTLDASDEAISNSIMSTPKDLVPGPDGIPYSLIRNASPIFIPVVKGVLRTMMAGSLPMDGFTDGFINFIPKKDLVPTPNNLRPLTIPNSIHRLVGKIISDQLQPSLNKNIHPCQSAFISGRWITDNVASVNNILRQKKDGWLLFVDFSKAYDSVDRRALMTILRKFRFSREVIAVIQASMKPYQVRSRYLDVTIEVDRGVPQGWSLSCVLFNIVIDPLLRTLSWVLPDLFQSAFADDLSFHHLDFGLLPVVQKFIYEYGNAIGLAVNERKCAVISIRRDPPKHLSIWSSPFVEEYKYLGVLLGLDVPVEKVFRQTIDKLRDRAQLFSAISANFTSKVLLAKIYLYPLVSYLLNFYSMPASIEREFCSIVQKFIFPHGDIKREILFAYPPVMASPNLENPRAYALRFTFMINGAPHHLLEPDCPVRLPIPLKSKVFLTKLEKHAEITSAGVANFSTTQCLDHRLSHFFLQTAFNILPFHSRVHHYHAISDRCALCSDPLSDNPSHLVCLYVTTLSMLHKFR